MTRNLGALFAYLASRAAMPHAWGRRANDCVSHAAGALLAMTGEDRLGDLDWSTEAEAHEVLAAEGGIELAVDRRYVRVPIALAQRGDIAGILDPELGLRLAIIEGPTLVGPGPRRQLRVPRAAMTIAWSASLPGSEADG